MSRVGTYRRLAVIMALVCCAAGFAVARQAALPERGAPVSQSVASSQGDAVPVGVPELLRVAPMAPVAAFREIEARPLFFASRRPVAPAPRQEQSQKQDAPPPNAVLTGTIITPRERVALLKIKGVAGLSRISEGGDVGGWTLSKVLPQTVELTEGERLHRLKIFKPAVSVGTTAVTPGLGQATNGFDPDGTAPPNGATLP